MIETNYIFNSNNLNIIETSNNFEKRVHIFLNGNIDNCYIFK